MTEINKKPLISLNITTNVLKNSRNALIYLAIVLFTRNLNYLCKIRHTRGDVVTLCAQPYNDSKHMSANLCDLNANVGYLSKNDYLWQNDVSH